MRNAWPDTRDSLPPPRHERNDARTIDIGGAQQLGQLTHERLRLLDETTADECFDRIRERTRASDVEIASSVYAAVYGSRLRVVTRARVVRCFR